MPAFFAYFAMGVAACFSQTAVPQPTSTIQVALGPSGFWPSTITRKTGRVYLAVFNRLSRKGAELRLTLQSTTTAPSATMQDLAIGIDLQDLRQYIDLAPGTYLLTEASHPAWTCKIIIQ